MQQVPLIVTLILGERGTLARMDVVDQLIKMYEESVDRAHAAVKAGDRSAYSGVRYPRLTVTVDTWQPIDRTEPFGYVEEAGVYSSVFPVRAWLRAISARCWTDSQKIILVTCAPTTRISLFRRLISTVSRGPS